MENPVRALRRQGRSGRGATRAIALIVLASLVFVSSIVNATENLISNGDLSSGTGDQPTGWQPDGWGSGPQNTTYSWHHRPGAPGEVEVVSSLLNDARWTQTIHLASGWYHFTASIRSEGVGAEHTGANLSLLDDGIISPQLHGTTDWQTVGFYLKVGPSGADVTLACRLGGYASLNVGKVFCRGLKGVRVEEPPGEATPQYDLDVIRNTGKLFRANSASSHPLQVTLMVLAGLGLFIGLFISRESAHRARAWLRRSADKHIALSCPISPQEPARREIEIALFLVCLLTFAYFYQASDHSTACRIDLVRALVERHTLWIDGYAGYNTADIMNWGPHLYPAKAPGASFTGILPWILVTVLLRPFLSDGGLYWAFVTYLTIVLSVSLIVALTVVVMYRCALLFGASCARAVAVALTLAFATTLFPYATEFTGEPIAAACEFGAFYLLVLPNTSEQWTRSLGAGLLAAWGVLSDFPTLLLAVAVAGYALWRLRSWRRVAPFAAGAAAVAALLLAHNEIAFGKPFFLSYEALMLAGNTRFPEQSVGFVGVTFHPTSSVLWDVLLGAQRGLFFCNPVLLLAIVGLFVWRLQTRLRAEFTVVAIAIAIFILFNASLTDSIRMWGGGTATGPRHMIPVLPFLVLAMAFIPKQLNRCSVRSR
jgi:hypothetical protein